MCMWLSPYLSLQKAEDSKYSTCVGELLYLVDLSEFGGIAGRIVEQIVGSELVSAPTINEPGGDCLLY